MKKILFLFLLSPIALCPMESKKPIDNKQSTKKQLPRPIDALDELTSKEIGCSEYITTREVKYTHEKDLAIQKKVKHGVKENAKGVVGFLEIMDKKYHNHSNKPEWLTSIDPECKPFSKEISDACGFTLNGKHKDRALLWSYCSNLYSSIEPLSAKNQALLDFALDAYEIEGKWLNWYGRKIIGGTRDGHWHPFERTIGYEEVLDEHGNRKRQFNKKENMEEDIVIPIKVPEHLNSIHYQRIKNPYACDSVSICNALENENYHNELMFMERQLLKMRLFQATYPEEKLNEADKQYVSLKKQLREIKQTKKTTQPQVEAELDQTWNKKENTIKELDEKLNNSFPYWLQLLAPIGYIVEKEKTESKKHAEEEAYTKKHTKAEANLSNILHSCDATKTQLQKQMQTFDKAALSEAFCAEVMAEEKLKEQIKSFKNPINRPSITRSCVPGSYLTGLQVARERYSKE